MAASLALSPETVVLHVGGLHYVLVAVAIATGWLYSVGDTFFIAGDVFYEASAMLAGFVLLGHWFEMRARGRPSSTAATAKRRR